MTLKKLIEKKDQMADWIIGDITHIIQTFEKRSPGSKGELQACEYYAELCEEYGCEEVVVEEFEEHPNSFFGWLYFAVTFVLISLGTYWFAPIIGAILCSLGALIALLQFGMYKKFMDRFFKKATGHNMMAIKKPKGEVKQRIFYNGHCDAVWEWPVNYHFGGVAFEAHAVLGFGGLFYTLGISIASMIKNGSIFGGPATVLLTKMGVYGLAFVPFLIGLYFLWNERHIVDGANDNLTGCESSRTPKSASSSAVPKKPAFAVPKPGQKLTRASSRTFPPSSIRMTPSTTRSGSWRTTETSTVPSRPTNRPTTSS